MTAKRDIPYLLLQSLEHVPGFDMQSFLQAHETPAAISIRLHPQKKTEVPLTGSPVPWCAEGLYLPERPVFTLDPAYHAGAYYVQEASSMFLDYMFRSLLPQRDDLRVLDLCAAPGGKTTLLASALGKNSLLVANEVIRSRASILEENVCRWGYMNTWVTSNDARDFGRVGDYFDAIVVDAPCSGSGLFRKDAAAIDEWSEENVTLCGERQQRILSDVWHALKPGGILIYATCSYSPAEDEAILDWIKTTFGADTLAVLPPEEWGIVATESPLHGMKGYRFFPHKIKGEGFFIAAVRKEGAGKPAPKTAQKQNRFKTAHDKKAAPLAAHLLKEQDFVCLAGKEGYHAILPAHEPDLQLLQQFVYLRRTGVEIGSPAAKEWIPSHDLALSTERSNSLPVIDLGRQEALKFLKKEDFGSVDAVKGWNLIAYQGLGLGWVKNLGNRFNNYLPKNWRIRMELPE